MLFSIGEEKMPIITKKLAGHTIEIKLNNKQEADSIRVSSDEKQGFQNLKIGQFRDSFIVLSEAGKELAIPISAQMLQKPDIKIHGNEEHPNKVFADNLGLGLTIYGGAGADEFVGGSGNDSIYGQGGNDLITGASGDDSLYGGEGDDVINGSAGDDSISGGKGNDVLNGGAGKDWLAGEAGNDTITGAEGNDTIKGGEGKDVINGGLGNDSLFGGKGNDYINGGLGNDSILGDEGNDVLSGDSGDDSIFGGKGNDLIRGNKGKDNLYGDHGNDLLFGNDGNDYISGDEGNDRLSGGKGDDALWGGKGNDRLYGFAGKDGLHGGDGNDRLYGGSGKDQLEGGLGSDLIDGQKGFDEISDRLIDSNDKVVFDYKDFYSITSIYQLRKLKDKSLLKQAVKTDMLFMKEADLNTVPEIVKLRKELKKFGIDNITHLNNITVAKKVLETRKLAAKGQLPDRPTVIAFKVDQQRYNDFAPKHAFILSQLVEKDYNVLFFRINGKENFKKSFKEAIRLMEKQRGLQNTKASLFYFLGHAEQRLVDLAYTEGLEELMAQGLDPQSLIKVLDMIDTKRINANKELFNILKNSGLKNFKAKHFQILLNNCSAAKGEIQSSDLAEKYAAIPGMGSSAGIAATEFAREEGTIDGEKFINIATVFNKALNAKTTGMIKPGHIKHLQFEDKLIKVKEDGKIKTIKFPMIIGASGSVPLKVLAEK